VARLLALPFEAATAGDRCNRKLALLKVLDWLELHPGRTWQERWEHATSGDRDWRDVLMGELSDRENLGARGERLFKVLGPGVTQLVTADVIRPSLSWLMTTPSPQRIANETERVRDPAGFARLREVRDAGTFGNSAVVPALEKVSLILAAKGGTVADVTVGDCLELLKASRDVFPGPARSSHHSPFFYQVLHAAGVFPATAPPTVRMFSSLFAGQLTVEQMVDRYDLACRPARDLLVDYLRERQPGIDYNSLTSLATTLALWFWKDLETLHPGISSLRLAPDIATAWKQRIRVKRTRGAAGRDGATEERKGATDILITVRAFIQHGTSISDGTTPMASIDWNAAITALHAGELPCSGGERRVLELSASLAGGIPVDLRDAVTGLDDGNIARLVSAVLHASGKRPGNSGY
jgi:hypothetical protein